MLIWGSYAETLLLDGDVEDYEYLNKSRREVDGIDDKEEWALLKVWTTRLYVDCAKHASECAGDRRLRLLLFL